MGIHHSPHTHTIPIPMGIPMGIPIPTAALMVIELGVNGKPICDFLLVINCNFSRICYRFRDIHVQRQKTADFNHPSLV